MNIKSPESPILKLENISLSYGSRTVLDNINLQIQSSEWLAILGVNGSGKSSLLKAGVALAPISSGKIKLCGEELKNLTRRQISRLITFLPQRAHVHVPYVVRDLLQMSHYASSSTMTLEQCAELFDIQSLLDRRINELSGGEYQRVMLAGAFFQGTALVALDEPTTHLDLKAQHEVSELLIKIKNQRRTGCLVVTHDLRMAKNVADRIAIMDRGRIIAEFDQFGTAFQEVVCKTFELQSGTDV